MYEPNQKSERLTRALHDASFREQDVAELARILKYPVAMLGDDIRALYDEIITNAQAKEEPVAADDE